jgi:hypothetical protein
MFARNKQEFIALPSKFSESTWKTVVIIKEGGRDQAECG